MHTRIKAWKQPPSHLCSVNVWIKIIIPYLKYCQHFPGHTKPHLEFLLWTNQHHFLGSLIATYISLLDTKAPTIIFFAGQSMTYTFLATQITTITELGGGEHKSSPVQGLEFKTLFYISADLLGEVEAQIFTHTRVGILDFILHFWRSFRGGAGRRGSCIKFGGCF